MQSTDPSVGQKQDIFKSTKQQKCYLSKKKKLLLMHTFSESPRKMRFIKIKERKIGKHGIQKKGDITQNRIPNPPKWEKMQDQTLAISIRGDHKRQETTKERIVRKTGKEKSNKPALVQAGSSLVNSRVSYHLFSPRDFVLHIGSLFSTSCST